MEQLYSDKFSYHYLEAVFKAKDRKNEIFYSKLQKNFDEYNFEVINQRNKKEQKCWYWKYLSNQPNISWNIVKKNKNANWNYQLMSLNENINLKIIKNNNNLGWDFNLFCSNKNFKIEYIKQIPIFSIFHYSRNPNFSLQDLNDYKDSDIDWDHISYSKIVNIDFVSKNLDKKWNWELLSSNSNFVDFNKYQSNPNLQWCFNGLIQNKNFTFNQLQKINNSYWLFFQLYSNNENINWNLIIEYSIMNWDFEALSKNKSLKWDFVKENLDLPWSWYELSQHKNINMDIIISNKHLCWIWEGVSKNPNLNPQIILNNLHLSWDPISLILNRMTLAKNNFVRHNLKQTCKNLLKESLNEDCIYHICSFL